MMHQGERCGVGSFDGTSYYADCYDPPVTSCVGCTWTVGDNGVTLTNTSSGISATGPPTSGQIAQWTSATNLQGLTPTGTGTTPVLNNGPTLIAPILGTPASVNLSNATALPCAAMPALTGVVTSVAAGCVTSFAVSPSFTTPNIGAATGTSLFVSGALDGHAVSDVSTTTACTLGTASASCGLANSVSGYMVNEHATPGQAVTYTLPTASKGAQWCTSNGNPSASSPGTPNTGVLTVAASAAGQFITFTDGTNSATGGNVTSGGAAADSACFIGVDTTHWQLYVQRGVWTKH